MVKPSKYLLVFTGLFILLGTGIFIACQKFLPILLKHTVYYCQSALQSFSMQVPSGIGMFLTGLLLFLIGYTLIKLVVSYIKIVSFRGKLHSQIESNLVFDQLVDRLNLQNKAFLIRDKRPFAFCHGMRHPRIYISTALFSMTTSLELDVVLRHEKYHLEHKDSFILLLAEIMRSLFPFFPLLSDLIHNYRIERELAADHEAVHGLGNTRSLISILRELLTVEPIEQFAFAPALADHETLEVRIRALTKKDFRFIKFSLLNVTLSILSIGIFVVLISAPVQAIEMHDADSDVMMVCLRNDECAAWCRENRTVVPYSKAPNASYPQVPMIPNMSPLE